MRRRAARALEPVVLICRDLIFAVCLPSTQSGNATGTLVSSAVKQATFQTTAPVLKGAGGVAGISDEDEAMHQVIAASLAERNVQPLASPSEHNAIDMASSDASDDPQPAQVARAEAAEPGSEPAVPGGSQAGCASGNGAQIVAASDAGAFRIAHQDACGPQLPLYKPNSCIGNIGMHGYALSLGPPACHRYRCKHVQG